MALGKFMRNWQQSQDQMNSLFSDPARRNELINYDPVKNPLGFIKINPEKFADQFNEKRNKLINEATATTVNQEQRSKTNFAGNDIQMELEKQKLLGFGQTGRRKLLGI